MAGERFMKKKKEKSKDNICKSKQEGYQNNSDLASADTFLIDRNEDQNSFELIAERINNLTDENSSSEQNQDSITKKHSSVALRISVISIVVNILLALFKLIAGIIGNSYAIITDAIHSASDVFSTFIVIIGVKIASKKADRNHPYGHERFESVASIILAVMLAVTGGSIGYGGILNIVNGTYKTLETPTMLALSASIVSIIVKEIMFWLTIIPAKKIGSGALKADAWHHRSDALSSIGSFVGVIFAMYGFPIMDSVAGLVICLMIFKVAFDIFKDSIDKMTDSACDKQTEEKLRIAIKEVEGVLNLDILKTRKFGDRLYVEVEISANGRLLLYEAHEIAEKVHKKLEHEFPNIKHCTVHVNPLLLEE